MAFLMWGHDLTPHEADGKEAKDLKGLGCTQCTFPEKTTVSMTDSGQHNSLEEPERQSPTIVSSELSAWHCSPAQACCLQPLSGSPMTRCICGEGVCCHSEPSPGRFVGPEAAIWLPPDCSHK